MRKTSRRSEVIYFAVRLVRKGNILLQESHISALILPKTQAISTKETDITIMFLPSRKHSAATLESYITKLYL
jgi:hypothetical protein